MAQTGQPSVMRHDFSKVPSAEIPRSSFDRSHGCKTTFDAGFLIPVFTDEALPGDTFNLKMSAFGRLSTPLHPFMDNLFMDSFFFAVPVRLIWDNFQKFNGEQRNPGDTTDFLVPTITGSIDDFKPESLYDHFGIPTNAPHLEINALYCRAYNLIWNEWFRDQNMQDSVPNNVDDGPDEPDDYFIQRRGKRHDYFTSALPWPQKGPAVGLPLGDTAPITGIGIEEDSIYAQQTMRTTGGDDITGSWSPLSQASFHPQILEDVADNPGYPLVEADLSNATAATINQLRQAFQIQKLYERDARGGTRYTEVIRSHFGVTSPDARLQRPEYLGGGSTPINVNPVAQTSETQAGTPQANLAAIGTLSANNHGFTKSFTEHMIIIGLVSVRADLNYQQGLNRAFTRSTRWDYYWPALSHIGEQAILNKEIFAQGSVDPNVDAQIFGYQERYAEYRYKPSIITGQFRSNYAQSLDAWHLAQDFANVPALNEEFIEENPPVERILAVPSEPHFILDCYFNFKTARPMPMYSVPGLIDHF